MGADGVEFFAWTGPKSGRIRLHNADGSVAEISGNGTRCVAAWMASERNLQPGDDLEIATDAGVRVCHLNGVNTDGKYHRGSDNRHGRSHVCAADSEAGKRHEVLRASKFPPAIRIS